MIANEEAASATARKALEAARGELSAWLAVEGLAFTPGATSKPRGRKAAAGA